MLNRDKLGYILDANLDGGDSANRAGILALLGSVDEQLDDYMSSKGVVTRHPTQVPWNNPKNFTRDQLIPFVAGLHSQGRHYVVKDIFIAHAKRGFFCQNTERDYPGSTKYSYPHTYFDATDGRTYSKKFDFADILMPGDIWHLILCGKIRSLYWFGLIGIPWTVLDIMLHALFNKSDDEGQIISRCVVAGRTFVRLYTTLKHNWKDSLKRYWVDRRSMDEIYYGLINKIG